MIEIVAPGPSTTVQDLGRPGWAALGVPRSGAFDRGRFRLANRLVGNPETAAALEITFGGLRVRLLDAATIALTGAPCGGAPDWDTALSLPAGTEFALGAPAAGLRSYLAVRGGLAVEPVLGSRSTDRLSGLGPPELRAGDRVPVGRRLGPVAAVSASGPGPGRPGLLFRFGPREDWFTPAALDRLTTATWTVRPDCDRVGVRLDGPALERAVGGELPSEATLPGAVQVPADGRPIVFGPDAPVTGGYPVIGCLVDLDAAAQLRPGDRVGFVPVR